MGYEIRDRSDGMFELVFAKPVLVGIFPERDGAEQYRTFLADQESELPVDEPASIDQALKDVAEVEADDLSEIAPPPVRKSPLARNLPAVVPEKPKAPVQVVADSGASFTPEQRQEMFSRIHNGEKVIDVAKDFGISFGQLRGMWANHKRYMQKYMAEDGREPCLHCKRMFTPSLSNPYTCARCSK